MYLLSFFSNYLTLLDWGTFFNLTIYFVVISDLELKPTGVLEVKLVQAKELTNKDVIGKSDPFAELYVRPIRDRTKKSKTIVRISSTHMEEFG